MRKLTRREFVRLSAVAAAGALASACVAPTTPEMEEEAEEPQAPEEEAAEESGVSTKQAAMLQEKVQAGELPPLTERLPSEPLVLEPVEEVGTHGGEVRRAFLGPSDWLAYGKFATMDSLIRWNRDPKQGMVPCVVREWEVNDDATVYTLYIREGIKWSDGEPFTVDDILFQLDEIGANDEIPEAAPMMYAGEPVTYTKIDDFTIEFKFAESCVFAADNYFNTNLWAPAHYLKQFHPEFSDVEGWDLFREKIIEIETVFFDIDRPVIQAWKVISWSPGTRLVAERNPYYWKVDPEGNQLPYLDTVITDVVKSSQTYPLKAIAGELDVQCRHMSFADYPLLKENEEQGDYRVLIPTEARGGPALYLNWDTPKENLRPLIRNKDFRIALSVAINREEINETLYHGTQEPQSYTFTAGSMYYDADLAKMYTEYDPERAKQTFDELGLVDNDGDGIREYEDGTPVTITIWVRVGQSLQTDVSELVAEQWQDVGINGVVNAVERSLLSAQCTEPEGPVHDALVWQTGGASTPLRRSNRWGAQEGGLPGGEVCWWQCSANRWFLTDGEEGEEPDPGIKRIQELWYNAQREPDPEKRTEMGREINRIHAENVYCIGTTTRATIGIAKNKLRNIPEDFIFGNFSKGLAITRPEQFFWKT